MSARRYQLLCHDRPVAALVYTRSHDELKYLGLDIIESVFSSVNIRRGALDSFVAYPNLNAAFKYFLVAYVICIVWSCPSETYSAAYLVTPIIGKQPVLLL